jgi:hypothetical protein
MPKIRNLAALAAAVEAGRRYARSNPDKAGHYVDQAAAFLDKQTKGRYHGQIGGVVSKVKSAAGLPAGPRTQGFSANGGSGRAYGTPPPVTPPVTSTTPPVTPATPPTTTTTTGATADPDRTFPGSKDV